MLGKRIETLMAAFQRLSQREKLMVGGVGAALVLFIGFFIHMGFASSLNSMSSRIDNKTKKLIQIIELRKDFEDAKQGQRLSQERMRRGAGIDLKATIEQQAEKLGVAIQDMKSNPPSVDVESGIQENKVAVNIELITLDRLVDFLSGIEQSSQTVAVRKLRVKKSFKQPDHLEVSFSVSNFQLTEAKAKETKPAKGKPAKKVK
ncbi:MAG: type II secretion system protein M [Deltaproteobacteria bacterium]|nr:type II secretion system protein M [Deltaproteobacteria bacterium]